MSQQGKKKIKRLLDLQARNQLRTPGRRVFYEGDKLFKLCPMVSKHIQHIFPVRAKNFLGGFAALVTGLWTSMHQKKQKFSCVLYPHSQFLCSLAKIDISIRGVRQSVQPHTFNAQLPVFDNTLAQPDLAVVNMCSDVVMSVFHSLFQHGACCFCSYELLCRSVEFVFLR